MTTAEALIAALEASALLKASNIKIVRFSEDHDIDSDRNKVRVELTFDVR
jgi:hypothetical protein